MSNSNLAERLANLLILTQDNKELRRAGLHEFSDCVQSVVEAENLRLLAFADESFLIDRQRSGRDRDLMTFDSVAELASQLANVTSNDNDNELRALVKGLLQNTGDPEDFDDDEEPEEDDDTVLA